MTRPGLLATPGSPDDNPHDFYNLVQFAPAAARPAESVTAAEDTADETLAVWAATGDPAAFGELYRRYHRMVAGHLRRRGIDPAEVDDLTQEVFTTALGQLHDGAFAEDSFRRWLFGIAVPRALTPYFGARWCQDQAMGGLTLTAHLPHPDVTPPPSLPARVVAALATLTPRSREVIELRYIEGQSIAATALVLGMSESTVQTRTGTAMRDLYKALTGTDRPRRPKTASLEELLPVALEIATEALAAGDRWSLRVLRAGLKARQIPIRGTRADELNRMVRKAMPEADVRQPAGLGRVRARGGARS